MGQVKFTYGLQQECNKIYICSTLGAIIVVIINPGMKLKTTRMLFAPRWHNAELGSGFRFTYSRHCCMVSIFAFLYLYFKPERFKFCNIVFLSRLFDYHYNITSIHHTKYTFKIFTIHFLIKCRSDCLNVNVDARDQMFSLFVLTKQFTLLIILLCI